jgi:hypothetical protein
MPAYIQHRQVKSALIVCPCGAERPMYVREVEPHWSMAKIDFILECSDCGAEMMKTITKPERRQESATTSTRIAVAL